MLYGLWYTVYGSVCYTVLYSVWYTVYGKQSIVYCVTSCRLHSVWYRVMVPCMVHSVCYSVGYTVYAT